MDISVERYQVLLSTINQQKIENARLSEANANLSRHIQFGEPDRIQMQNEITRLTAENEVLRNRGVALDGEYSRVRDRFNDLLSECRQLESKSVELNAANAREADLRQELLSVRRTLRQAVCDRESVRASLTQTIEYLQSENIALSNELDRTLKSNNSVRASVEGEFTRGAQWMLDSIRFSLTAYPHLGGDIVVMQQVDRIVLEALQDARRDE